MTSVVKHAGYLVDADTGEIVRELDTTRQCRMCHGTIERQGSSGRPPAHCAECQAARRRAADADRKRRTRVLREQAPARVTLGAADAAGSLLIFDGREGSQPRPGRRRSRRAEVIEALGIPIDGEVPFVIDRYLDETGRARDVKPYGWHSDAGDDVGTTLGRDSVIRGEIYGRGGLREAALKHPWWSERKNWRHDLHIESRNTCPQEQIEVRAA